MAEGDGSGEGSGGSGDAEREDKGQDDAAADESTTAAGANARTAGAPLSASTTCGGASICAHRRVRAQCKDFKRRKAELAAAGWQL